MSQTENKSYVTEQPNGSYMSRLLYEPLRATKRNNGIYYFGSYFEQLSFIVCNAGSYLSHFEEPSVRNYAVALYVSYDRKIDRLIYEPAPV